MDIQQNAVTAEVLDLIAPSYLAKAVRKDHTRGVASPARMSLDTFTALHTLTREVGPLAMAGLAAIARPISEEQMTEIERLIKYAPYEHAAELPGTVYRVKSTQKESKRPSAVVHRTRSNDWQPRAEKARPEKVKVDPKAPVALRDPMHIKSAASAVIGLLTARLNPKLAEIRASECRAPETMGISTYSALRQLPLGKLVEPMYDESNGQIIPLQGEVERLMGASPWAIHPGKGIILKSEMPTEADDASPDGVSVELQEATAAA